MQKNITHSIILARGGSKGIKNKNLILLKNKPLIYWSIFRSLNSKKIDYTWVSSDSNKILKVAKKFGARVIKRPKIYAGDNSSSESAWAHAIRFIEQKKIKIDIIVGIQPTSPIRDQKDFDKAIKTFTTKKLDSLFSANMTNDTNFWIFKNKKLIANYNYKKRKMRQQSNKKFLENGSFYIFNKKNFFKHHCRLFGKIGFYLTKKINSFQIDDLEDLKLIQTLIKK